MLKMNSEIYNDHCKLYDCEWNVSRIELIIPKKHSYKWDKN